MKYSEPIRWWLQNLSAAHVFLNNDTIVAPAGDDICPFDEILFDNLGEYSEVAHQFTALRTGYYLVGGLVSIQTGAGAGDVGLYIERNGISNMFFVYDYMEANTTYTIPFARAVEISAGHFIRCKVYNSTPNNITILGQNVRTSMYIEKLPVLT